MFVTLLFRLCFSINNYIYNTDNKDANLYDRATLPLQNGRRGLDWPDFFYGIRWASRFGNTGRS